MDGVGSVEPQDAWRTHASFEAPSRSVSVGHRPQDCYATSSAGRNSVETVCAISTVLTGSRGSYAMESVGPPDRKVVGSE